MHSHIKSTLTFMQSYTQAHIHSHTQAEKMLFAAFGLDAVAARDALQQNGGDVYATMLRLRLSHGNQNQFERTATPRMAAETTITNPRYQHPKATGKVRKRMEPHAQMLAMSRVCRIHVTQHDGRGGWNGTGFLINGKDLHPSLPKLCVLTNYHVVEGNKQLQTAKVEAIFFGMSYSTPHAHTHTHLRTLTHAHTHTHTFVHSRAQTRVTA